MKQFLLMLLLLPCFVQAQTADLMDSAKLSTEYKHQPFTAKPVTYKSFIIPAALVTYGFVALESDALKSLNQNTKVEILEHHPHFITHIDNYAQFAPAAIVFGLQAFGDKGVHTAGQAAVLYSMSMVISTAVVFPLKKITSIQRPDNSGFTSFPSGHTATAFAGAEFLRREYGQKYPWLAVTGYVIAGGTGLLRMYNNKHWFSDVAAGAGFGIASTSLAYWLYPKFNKKANNPHSFMALPNIGGGSYGVTLVKNF